MVTCGTDGMARVWDSGSGAPVHPPIAHNSDVTCVSLSPDGRYLLTASIDRSARIWDLSAGTWPTQVLRHGSWVSHGELSPDGRRAAAISRDGICRIWNLASGKPELVLDHGHRGDYATFSPDGRLIATVGYDSAARVWSAETGQLLAGPMVHTRRQAASSSIPIRRSTSSGSTARPNRLLTYSPREAIVWDWRSEQAVQDNPSRGRSCFTHATFSPDGTRVLVSANDGTAQYLGVVRGSPRRPVFRHAGSVLHAVFSNDGRRVLTASGDRTARIWDAARGTMLASLAHGDRVNHGSFSPDGTMVVTASSDRTAGIWSVETGKLLVPFLYHTEAVLQACFSADGTARGHRERGRAGRP